MQEKKHLNHWEQDWLEGKISSQEASSYASDTEHFEVLSKYVEKASSLGVSEKNTKEEVWRKLEEKIGEAPQTKVVSINRRYWLAGVAASFIVIISAFFLQDQLFQGNIDLTTALAETRTIYLPDSSVVYLNAETNISYSKKGWDTERVVTLRGEAFFEVKKGSNFSVTTPNGIVEVLGTSFNVRSRGKELLVACKTGKVRVTAFGNENTQILTPGLQTKTKSGNLIEPHAIKLDDIDLWREGLYYLESVSIKEGFEELERIFNVEVVHNLSKTELERVGTWDFDRNNLEESIQFISVSMGFKYKIEKDRITFE